MSALDNIKVAKDKPFSIDDIQVAKDKPFSIDNIKVTKDKPFSIDNIKVATDEDMGQIIDNKLDNTPSTDIPLQSELTLPEQIYQQHLKGQGYPGPKMKGILQLTREMFQWWGKKEWERGRTLPLLIANLNPTLRGVPLAQVGDKIINYGNMIQRIPATTLMLAKNKHEGKPNINNVSTKEALINAVKGDPTKPYGNVSLFVAIPRVIYPEKDWDIEQEVYKNASLVTKIFMDAPAFLGDISLTFITAGRIFLPAMKFLSPSGKISRIASKSVENAKQMILEHEELAKIKLDEIAKVDGYNVKLNQIQQDKINIDALSGTADALREQKKTLTTDELKIADQQLRSIEKVIAGAELELVDKINQLPRDIDALQSEVLADHTLIKNTLDDIIKSGVRSTGAEQEGIDQINKAYIELGGKIRQDELLYRGQSKYYPEMRKVDIPESKLHGVYATTSEVHARAFAKKEGYIFTIKKPDPKDVFDLTKATPDELKVLGDATETDLFNDPAMIDKLQSLGYSWWVEHPYKLHASMGVTYVAISDDAIKLVDIAKSAKDITSMQSAQSRIDNIKKMLALSDNMKEKIGNQIKRQLYTTGMRGLIKTTKTDIAGIKSTTGILKESKINDFAKAMTHGRVTDWKKLDGMDMESLYDTFKGVRQIDKEVGWIQNMKSGISPEAETFMKLKALKYYSAIENGVFAYNTDMRAVDRIFGDFLNRFKSATGKRWVRGGTTDDLLAYMLENPNQIPEIYNQPEVAGLLTDVQKTLVKEAADEWKKITAFVKDILIKQGKLSTDVEGFNALKAQKQILDDNISVMRAGKKLLTPKTDEFLLATARIADAGKKVKKINKAIKDFPPLVVEHYFSHKSMLAKNIINDIQEMDNTHAINAKLKNKAYAWTSDSLPPYAKNAFAGIPANINSPELMKRISEGKLNRRDTMAVMREAISSELRNVHLAPVFKEGKAYIDALPEGEYRLKLHEMYDALVRVTRNMEHPLDKGWNTGFYKISRGIEKVVKPIQHITGGRLHYEAQTRAFDHFISSTRNLAFMKTLWGNTWNVAKNTFQITQSIASIGSRATLAGVEGAMVRDGMWTLEQLPTFLGSLHLIENFTDPKGMMGWANDVGMIGQTITERNWNRAGAGLGAIYHAVTKSQKNMDDLMRFALTHNIDPKSVKGNNFWTVWRQYVEAGNGKEIMMGANETVRVTQYDYARYATMPLLHSSWGRILFMFTNWSSHYFMSFLTGEHGIWRQLIRGTSTLEVAGVHYKWTDPDRYGIFKYILATAGTYAIGKSLGFDMGWQLPQQQISTGNIAGVPVPIAISPPLSFLLDLGTCVIDSLMGRTAGAESAWARVINDVYPNAVKHVGDIITEKQPPQSIIMKTAKEEVGVRGIRTHPSRSARPTTRIGR